MFIDGIRCSCGTFSTPPPTPLPLSGPKFKTNMHFAFKLSFLFLFLFLTHCVSKTKFYCFITFRESHKTKAKANATRISRSNATFWFVLRFRVASVDYVERIRETGEKKKKKIICFDFDLLEMFCFFLSSFFLSFCAPDVLSLTVN